MTVDDDSLIFVSEDEADSPATTESRWRVLVIDDDPDVHSSTAFALEHARVLDRGIELLHARSAAEARALLIDGAEPAVILLDVVMETPDAGLALVDHIRRERGLTATRIVLRTGQPGYAPEHETLSRYDINDYKSKSEFTQHKLVTAIMAAVRSYEQIRVIEANRRGLQQIVEASATLLEMTGLQRFASGVLTQLAGLLSVPADGMVCAQGPSSGGPYTVLAAAGAYSALIDKPLDRLLNHPAAERLRTCLQQRRNYYGDQETVLYIGTSDGRDMAIYLPTARPVDALMHQLLDVFCVNLSAGLRNVHLIERLQRVAYEDPLLQIPNRAYLIEHIDRAQGRQCAESTLLLVDIDDFGGINELMGHEFADQVLVAMVQRLREIGGPETVVARVAGDAFGLLGPRGQLDAVAVRSALEDPLRVDGQPFKVQVSIGVCNLAEAARNGAEALKNGFTALKHAKQQHRGSVVVFDPDMAQRSRHHAELLARLNAAFNDNQLYLAYQPQIDLTTRAVIGLEALVRWRRDDGQPVPPDRFIPVAEQSGLIVPLGEWVLKTACHDMRRLIDAGNAPHRVAVNVSVAQFQHDGFIDTVQSALAETGLAADRLELEITESVAMLGEGRVQPMLTRLRALGVTVAIDDFGTGYSSLAYLEQLPLDRIKIDRAFVRSLQTGEGARIAEMVAQLGRKLGLQVLAEGIEDEAVWHQLCEIGCHEGQGFHIGRPMTFDELTVWLQAWLAQTRN